MLPGLATAEILEDRGHQVVLWMAGKAGEVRLAEEWTGPVVTVSAEGFSSPAPKQAMSSAFSLMRAARTCTGLMRRNRPDILLGMGSYASVGPVWAAMRLKIPFVLHEANVLPGRAVSLFSRRAAAIAGSFEETRYYLRRKDLVLTGMPLRRHLASAARDQGHRALDPNQLTVLVMGGSHGAAVLNDVVTQALVEAGQVGHQFQVIHLAGEREASAVRERYAAGRIPAAVYGFAREMAEVYSRTDLAICRSGAATCAELSAFGVPALLVPYPFASKDHQMANARAMEKVGAADVVPEDDLGVSWLKDYVGQSIQTPSRLARMSAATRQRAQDRGAEALADLLEQVAARNFRAGLSATAPNAAAEAAPGRRNERP